MRDIRILIVDNEDAIRKAIRNILQISKNYAVDEAVDGQDCLEKARSQYYNCIFLDITMPRMSGIDALERLKTICPDTPVIMISAQTNLSVAVDCCRMGAFDYIEKPIDMQRLLISLDNALDTAVLKTENKNLKQEQSTLKQKVSIKNKSIEIIGESEGIQKVRSQIEKAAKYDNPVLITGDTGAGKELVAKWIHELSARSPKPFLEVNSTAITKELFESTLFGHKAGSFTDAKKDMKGKFELSNEGSLFLDEIGDMDIDLQAKILKAIDEQIITPLGSEKSISVDVRFIAATNKDLKEEITKGKFRRDLYHRINHIEIHVPPLNERRDDIPLLVAHFSKLFSEKQGVLEKDFTPEAIRSLCRKDWEGNVRSLRAMIQRLYIFCDDKTEISEADVEEYVNLNNALPSTLHKYFTIFNRFKSKQELLQYMDNEYNVYTSMKLEKLVEAQ